MKQARPVATYSERQAKRSLTSFDLRCPPGEECPTCGECSRDKLVWDESGEHVLCDTCKLAYIPGHWKAPMTACEPEITNWKGVAIVLAEALHVASATCSPAGYLRATDALAAYRAALDGKETE